MLLIGSTCIYQGEELALDDVRDIPTERMQDPWGIEFAPDFFRSRHLPNPNGLGRGRPHGGFSDANDTWLPVAASHIERVSNRDTDSSVYTQFSTFLKWRKSQPALMDANEMSAVTGDGDTLSFKRIYSHANLLCTFDFKTLTAQFEDIT